MTEGGSTLKLKMPLAHARIAAVLGTRRPRGSSESKFPFEPRKSGLGVRLPPCVLAQRSHDISRGCFLKIVHPHTPHGCSLRKREGPRGELFVLFAEKTGGGAPSPIPPRRNMLRFADGTSI